MVEVLSRYRANPEGAQDFYFNEKRLCSAPAEVEILRNPARSKKNTPSRINKFGIKPF